MALEFIERVVTPSGESFLAEHSSAQVLFTSAPFASTLLQVAPSTSVYALLVFKMIFGAAVVPNAFNLQVVHRGLYLYNGTLSGTLLNNGIDFFLVATGSDPMSILATSNSALAQNFEIIYQFFQIGTKNQYEIILQSLQANNLMVEKLIEIAEKVGGRR